MTWKVDRQEFRVALNGVARATGDATWAAVTLTASTLTIEAAGSVVACRQRVPVLSGSSSASAVVPLHYLSSAVKAFDGTEVGITLSSDRMQLTCGTASIVAVLGTDPALWEIPTCDPAGTMKVNRLVNIAASLTVACTSNGTATDGVMIENDGSPNTVLAATDRYRLHVLDGCVHMGVENQRVLLPAREFKDAVGTIPDPSVKMCFVDGQMVLRSDRAVLSVRAMHDDGFPAWRGRAETPSTDDVETAMTFNGSAVARAAATVRKATGADVVSVEVVPEDHVLTVSAEAASGGVALTVPVLAARGGASVVTFAASELEDATRHLGDNARCWVTGPLSPVVFASAQSRDVFRAVLSPRRA